MPLLEITLSILASKYQYRDLIRSRVYSDNSTVDSIEYRVDTIEYPLHPT